jgi:protein-disulfide isomerase
VSDKSRKDRGQQGGQRNWLLIGAVAAALIVGGIYYLNTGSGTTTATATTDPAMSDLLQPGPLPEMELGNKDAPNTIIEYASLTCGHCANFHKTTFVDVKERYIDTGKVRYIFREFPFDNLAAAAFMLARCAGPDRYFPMIDALFQTQENWAFNQENPTEQLLQIARQAGISKERFDECLADKELLANIYEVRRRGHEIFGVESTPTFFVNGKRLRGASDIEEFDAVLSGEEPSEG